MTLFEELYNVVKDVEFEYEKKPTKISAPSAGEARDTYLVKLAFGLGAIPQDKFDGMSGEAQEWYNKAAQAINSQQTPPYLQGYDPEELGRAEAVAAELGTQTGRTSSSAPNKSNTPKPQKLFKGIGAAVREIVIDHLDWTTQQVIDELLKNGWEAKDVKPTSVTTIRIDTLSVITIAQKLGWKKEEKKAAA